MRSHLECIPCFLHQGLRAARMGGFDHFTRERVLRRIQKGLLELPSWDAPPPRIAQSVHRIIREETGLDDPYREVKERYNRMALNLVPELEEIIAASDDPLLTAVKLAIAGNIIDFGAAEDFDLHATIERVLASSLAIDRYDAFHRAFLSARTVLYLADNTGEIVFDRMLLERMLSLREDHPRILVGVKGGPMINDATREDAEAVGLAALPGVELFDVDIGIPDTGVDRMSPEFIEFADTADIVVCKGQGNYEALSNNPGFFFLLMAKCEVLARHLDVAPGSIVLTRGERA